MLATQLNNLIKDNQLQPNSVVRLRESICNSVHGRRIVIILNLDIVAQNQGSLIGNPQNIETAVAGAPPPQPQQQQKGGPSPYQKAPVKNQNNAQPQQQQQRPQNNFQQQQQQQNNNMGANNFRQNNQNQHQNQQQTQQQQSQLSEAPIYPIKSLNPYQNRWTIKARVTSKTGKKTWQNDRGNGRLFSVDLLDNSGGEIRATMFNEAADHFFDIFELNQIYLISKGSLKIANKKFSNIKNEYELTLDMNTIVELANDMGDIPKNQYTFVSIDQIRNYPKDSSIDILGVVQDTRNAESFTTKAKKQTIKRTITLVDQSEAAIELTLWGDRAQEIQWDIGDHPIMAIKGVKVSDFGGKTLTTTISSQMDVNPDIVEAHNLKGWFDQYAGNISFTQMSTGKSNGSTMMDNSNRIFINQMKEDATNLPMSEMKFYNIKGTINLIRRDKEKGPWYLACPNTNGEKKCSKKVTPTSDGKFRCENCGTFPNYQPRYILSFSIADATGSQWVNCFNEIAEQLLGVPATEMEQWFSFDQGAFERTFVNAQMKQYIFRVKATKESYQETEKLRVTAMNCTEVNFQTECNALVEQISKWL
eukprot:TRINITY_DN1995_c0_g1_i1.p1 TRINITY_DN1995_c0_g1~~TRINITY_DN1995_c0_g1_i1.p1  ORF type:complete len:660 (+),score=203.99 TRINITY_DN1995_c0_g1_i1:216-1982(+)